MQHWHIFRQWNTCLFHEMFAAYQGGRADKDPRENWFESEIGFFKFYILPLADRVKHSSAFGALGAELYQCAESNLIEWEMKGERIVADLISETQGKPSCDALDLDGNKERSSTVRFQPVPETDVFV